MFGTPIWCAVTGTGTEIGVYGSVENYWQRFYRVADSEE